MIIILYLPIVFKVFPLIMIYLFIVFRILSVIILYLFFFRVFTCTCMEWASSSWSTSSPHHRYHHYHHHHHHLYRHHHHHHHHHHHYNYTIPVYCSQGFHLYLCLTFLLSYQSIFLCIYIFPVYCLSGFLPVPVRSEHHLPDLRLFVLAAEPDEPLALEAMAARSRLLQQARQEEVLRRRPCGTHRQFLPQAGSCRYVACEVFMKMMQKTFKITETLAYGYLSEISRRKLSNEY